MIRPLQRTLGVLAKWPVAGSVKTRLASATSDEWAARVATAFLEDTLDRLAVFDACRLLAFAPGGAEGSFAALAGDRFALTPQGDGNLGERLARFFAVRLKEADTVVVVGTDSPTLPLALVEQAFVDLERTDIVLGPATDGGYYLLGCRRFLPALFAGIDWGGERVLGQTVERLSDSSWRMAVLPPWYDIDSVRDWRMLAGHLAALRRAGIDPAVPRTEALTREPFP